MKIAVLPSIAAALMVSICPVSALDIVLVYNPIDDPTDGEPGDPGDDPVDDPPDFDLGGAKLTAIMEAAAAVWEDIIEDPGTITITYGYEPLGLAIARGTFVSFSAPWTGEVYFNNDPATPLYFDPTPEDHSEFDLVRKEYRDLSDIEQPARFGQTPEPPEVLEVSYSGEAVVPEAEGKIDALTSAIHEIGHALGLSGTFVTSMEIADGDYDVPAALGGGVAFAIKGQPYHIEPIGGGISLPLMCGSCATPGLRRLPTQTDVLALAAAVYGGNGDGGTMYWTDLDLPRKSWKGTGVGNWNTPADWVCGAIPDGDDAAFISGGVVVTVDERESVGEVTVSGAGTDLVVVEILHTDRVVLDSADLRLRDGLVTADEVELKMGFGAATVLGGWGSVDFDTSLVNNGTILADGSGNGDRVLKLVGAAGATIDYDGTSENGALQAVLGDVEFTGTQADDFDGVLTVNPERMMTFFDVFTVGSGGQMILNGGATPAPSDAAVIEGNIMQIAGEVDVNDECLFANFSTFFADGSLVDMIDADSRLTLENGAWVMTGARLIGPGRLSSRSDLFLSGGAEVGCELQSSGTVALQRDLNHPVVTATLGALDLSAADSFSLRVGSATDDAATDLAEVEGHASLGGDLLVTLDAASAQPGQRWTIMTFGSRTGHFSQIIATGVPAGMRLTPFYFGDRIVLVLQQDQSYDDWRAGYTFETGADSLASADPDCDGWPNQFEFVTDTDPLKPGSAPRVRTSATRIAGEDYLTMHIDNNLGIWKTGVQGFAESSLDLATWTEAGVVAANLQIHPSRPIWRWGYRLAAPISSNGVQCLRLGVRDF